jgi:predicted ribosome quality control (RQC) complex YloA/Tae2 family protein
MQIAELQKTVAELRQKLTGARVDKIHQPAADVVLLRLWNGRENLRLLLDANPQGSRLTLTDESFPNPFTPPRFCQLLRARIARIQQVEQLNYDRIVAFDCQGIKGDCRLVFELTGRASNLVLLDSEGQVIDALKRSSERVAPKSLYQLPAKPVQHQGDAVTVGKVDTPDVPVKSTDLKSRLKKLIKKELKKLRRRLQNIEKERGQQEDFELFRQRGDLLLANLHLLSRGDSEVRVVDYYQEPPQEVVIDLDKKLSPQENAERYFKKYKKAQKGLGHSSRRQVETEAELRWLEQLNYQLDINIETAEVVQIAAELKVAGLLKEADTRLPRPQAAGIKLNELLSPNGFKVLYGKNSRQNDYLSTRVLKAGDLWFHAYRCPGSHVVLKADPAKGSFTEPDVVFAASVAAAHSKSRFDSKVEVMQATKKQVKKPSGAKPGMVTVASHKTLLVQPYEDATNVF